MDSLVYKINLDCLRKDSQAIVNAKIGEASGRKIVFTLYEGRAPFFVPSDTTVVFRAKKPSGAVLYNNCVVDDGKIEYTITSQTVAEKGVFPCEIQIIGADNKVIYTPCITLNVTENLYSDTEVESSNEFTELENALNKIPPLEVIYSKYTKPEGGIPKSDLAQDVQNSLNKANTALQEHQSLAAYRTAEAQDLIDSTKQDKLTAGNNITIAEDGTISATGGVSNAIGYFEVTLTKQADGSYTSNKTYAQVKEEIANNNCFMLIDGYNGVFILTRIGGVTVEFAGMLDGTDGWMRVEVSSDERWEVIPEPRITLDWYNGLVEDIGKLTNLTTTDKTNLVAAINEVKQSTDSKQDKLIAGDNITIAADGKTISATGGGGGSSVELDTTLTQSGKAADAKAVGDALAGKQNTISDLETIRTGAAKGATALQTVPSTYRTASAQDTIDSGKVDKVTGKGLSTNDYTAAAKAKVDAIPANPKYTDTLYDDTAVKSRLSAVESKFNGNGSASFASIETASLKTTGEVEIFGAQPHIDFHHANNTDDYTSRIIETASGQLNLSAANGVQINGKKTENEAVTLTADSSRITNVACTAKYNELLGAVFVRIYGTINSALNTGYDYDLFTIGSRLPDAAAALSVKCNKNVMAVAKSNGVISIRPLESDINGYDVYITGFWFV